MFGRLPIDVLPFVNAILTEMFPNSMLQVDLAWPTAIAKEQCVTSKCTRLGLDLCNYNMICMRLMQLQQQHFC